MLEALVAFDVAQRGMNAQFEMSDEAGGRTRRPRRRPARRVQQSRDRLALAARARDLIDRRGRLLTGTRADDLRPHHKPHGNPHPCP
jgi:hypothetical protein